MMNNNSWLLPEGIEELLPAQAMRLETLQRNLLDMYVSWGYELVMPPFIEYLDSLLTGTGNDLDLQTFKITDQLTGRLMGIRADMTPQVARIDAHNLKREVPTRLCYMGTVLQTRPATHGGRRSPFQAGVELYGHAGIESDLEVLRLMIDTLHASGLEEVHLDLGHVGIFRGLAHLSGLDTLAEAQLFEALQRKAKPEIEELLQAQPLDDQWRDLLESLADLHGDASVLDKAEQLFGDTDASVKQALGQLRRVADMVNTMPRVSVHYDLAELRGYHYHTGIVFAAFVPGQGQAIAQGGRYDDIGRVFGRARPATGFSTDLKALLALVPAKRQQLRGIFAPCEDSPALDALISELRASGERVVQALPGQIGDAGAMSCDRELVENDGSWEVVELH